MKMNPKIHSTPKMKTTPKTKRTSKIKITPKIKKLCGIYFKQVRISLENDCQRHKCVYCQQQGWYHKSKLNCSLQCNLIKIGSSCASNPTLSTILPFRGFIMISCWNTQGLFINYVIFFLDHSSPLPPPLSLCVIF